MGNLSASGKCAANQRIRMKHRLRAAQNRTAATCTENTTRVQHAAASSPVPEKREGLGEGEKQRL